MQGSRAVQVVLGEGEPGILRFILEAEGFHVVGQARGESELRRVLDATHPSVIVLDAGISAGAANDARSRAIGAQLVVVWPNGVRASVAEERVDPSTALQDLGGAVRRAAERATGGDEEPIVTLPDPTTLVTVDRVERPLMVVPDLEDAAPPRARRRARQLLVITAAWTLALTASAAAGLTVQRTFGMFGPEVTPSIVPAPDTRSQDPSTTVATAPDAADPVECEQPDATGGQSDRGRHDDPGRACGKGAAHDESRPDDPPAVGRGNGRGDGAHPDPPGEHGNNGHGGDGNGGDQGADQGNGDDQGQDPEGGDDQGQGPEGGDDQGQGPEGGDDQGQDPEGGDDQGQDDEGEDG